MRHIWAFLSMLVLAAAPASAQKGEGPVVYADLIFQDMLNAHADRWAEKGHARPVLVFADTATLLQHLGNGTKGDLFISVDADSMDALQESGIVDPATRQPYRQNSVVLFGGAQARYPVMLANPAAVQRQVEHGGLRGRIAMANPDETASGRYAKRVLDYLGLWEMVGDRIILTETDREAVDIVEEGGAEWGITLGSTLRIFEASQPDNQVREFSQAKTNGAVPIAHFVARFKGAKHPQAAAFQDFLARDAAYQGAFEAE
ncbi:molybdate ABC transporter substrate-binding protein [Allosphingosinicella flava]|nr:molybdate ABC transporter substrate-binding protein [Sphingosinicella flava]